METKRLKSKFSRHITFWEGAVEPQHVLASASPEEVSEYSIHCTEVFKEGGGFVFTQPHNIQPGAPPENVITLYEAGNEHGKY